MNHRERLMRILAGEPVDRVSMWLLFPYHQFCTYVDVRNHPGYRPVFEASKQYAAMLDRRGFSSPAFAPDVTQETEESVENGCRIRRRHLRWRDAHLVEERRSGGDRSSVKKTSGVIRGPRSLRVTAHQYRCEADRSTSRIVTPPLPGRA